MNKDTKVQLAVPSHAATQSKSAPEKEKPQRFLRANDRSYKEVRRTIVRKQKAGAGAGDQNTEHYVDSYRNVAVQQREAGDLKSIMAQSGVKVTASRGNRPGEPDDSMYLKQAEHLIKRGQLVAADLYLQQALLINPKSKSVRTCRARCFLLMGKWEEASEMADTVLEENRCYVKALLVKAEALYNTCDFEHALVIFHRGQGLASDIDDFRLGIQKCRKTINQTVSKDFEFRVDPSGVLFEEIAKQLEAQESLFKAKYSEDPRDNNNKRRNWAERGHSLSNSSLANAAVSKKKVVKFEVKKGKMKRKKNDRLGEDKAYLNQLASGSLLTAWDNSGLLPYNPSEKPYLNNYTGGNQMRRDERILRSSKLTCAGVSATAIEALQFLEARDEFWQQVDLGNKNPPMTYTKRLDFESAKLL